MAIIHEWKCKLHGPFEGSHPICPEFGCESAEVEKEIRTPRGIASGIAKRTDADLRKTAESYGLSNLRSAKEGEMSKPDNRAAEVKWGDEGRKFLGGNVVGQPLTSTYTTARGEQKTVYNHGVMQLGDAPIMKSKLPTAEVRGHLGDKK